MRTSDFRAAARAVMQGKWVKTAAIVLLAGLLGASVGVSGSVFSGFDINYQIPAESLGMTQPEMMRVVGVTALVMLGMMLYLLFVGSYVSIGLVGLGCGILDGEQPRVGMLFPRGVYWKAVGLNFMRSLLISLWSLLFVIPGIIASYSYSMADYILYTHPEMGVMEVLRESKRRMYGHRAGLLVLELSFIGWALLASLPGIAPVITGGGASFWIVLGTGSIISLIASIFVQTYMHISFMAYFRNVDRASIWHNQAREGEEEFMHARFGEAEGEGAEGDVVRPEPEPYVDESVARSLFMEHGCSRTKLREAGAMEEYEQMNIDSSTEQRWIRDYARSLMLRFDRDALVLDALLMLAGEYAMDDLVSRVLERIERHIRQQTLSDTEILNMAGRVLALLVSGAFAENDGFVRRKKQQILDMAGRLQERLEQTGDGSWQEALRLIHSMCE